MQDVNEQEIFQRMVAAFDTPAFMRRAKRVESAWEQCLERCRLQRWEWLELPRLRLGTVRELAGSWPRVAQFLADGLQGVRCLSRLHDEWRPQLRRPLCCATFDRPIRCELERLQSSFETFNRRWRRYIERLDFSEINRLRHDYNRYYLIEKECALASPRVAERGFQSLPPVTGEHVLAEHPYLPHLRLV